jgi:hypothetical protein
VRAENVRSAEDFRRAFPPAFAGKGPALLALATAPDPEVVEPPYPLNSVVVKQRFMDALGAPCYVPSMFGKGRFVEVRPTAEASGKARPGTA